MTVPSPGEREEMGWANWSPTPAPPKSRLDAWAEHPPWWMYALVIVVLIVLLPLWLALLAMWWVLKAMGVSLRIASIPFLPQRIPNRYRNHGRSS